MVKIMVCGSRTFHSGLYLLLECELDELKGKYHPEPVELLFGDAIGADGLAKRYAFEHKLPYTEFPALWYLYKKGAGIKRTAEMVALAHCGMAFWNGTSRGTKIAIRLMERAGKPMKVFYFEDDWQSPDDALCIRKLASRHIKLDEYHGLP